MSRFAKLLHLLRRSRNCDGGTTEAIKSFDYLNTTIPNFPIIHISCSFERLFL